MVNLKRNFRFLFITILVCFYNILAFAQNNPIDPNEDPNAGLKIIDTQIYPYEGPIDLERKIIVKIQLRDGFRAYANKFKIHILEPYPVEEGNLEITPLQKFYDKFSKTEKAGLKHEGTLTLPFHINTKLKSGENSLKYELKFQSCTDTYCFFPKTLGDEVRFLVTNPRSKNVAAQTTSLLEDTFAGAQERGSLYLFVFVFLAGVLTSLTPCLLPILPLTLAVLGKGHLHDKKFLKFIHALVYVLGIATTYSALGLIAASSGSLFGTTLSNPITQVGFAVFFILMGIAQFGFFEIQTPLKIQNLFHKWGHDSKGIFMTGLLSGLVASPCVGPVLVGILTFVAQTQNLWLGFGLLFVYAFGMGQLLIILGVSSNLLYKFPKNPLLMKAAKTILGVALIAAGLFYLSLLWPKNFGPKVGVPSGLANQQDIVAFQDFSLERFDAALKSGKPVFIDFFAEWCLACKELESQTFTSMEVEILSREFIAFKFDATEESELLNQLKKQYGIVGLPSIIFFNAKGEWLKEFTLNEFENAKAFVLRLTQVLKHQQ
jgi:thiol:disulfide interchange protein DsbD